MTKDKIKITTTRAARQAAVIDPWLQVPAFFLTTMWVRRSDKDNEDGKEVQQKEDDDNGQHKTYRHLSITLCMMLK